VNEAELKRSRNSVRCIHVANKASGLFDPMSKFESLSLGVTLEDWTIGVCMVAGVGAACRRWRALSGFGDLRERAVWWWAWAWRILRLSRAVVL